MYLEIVHIYEIETPEEQVFLEKKIASFKNQLADAIHSINARLPNNTLIFFFDKKNRKFSVKEIPANYKVAFERALEIDYQIKKWF